MQFSSVHLTSRESCLALRQGMSGRCHLDVRSPQSARYLIRLYGTSMRQPHSHGARFQVVRMYLWTSQITGTVQQGRIPPRSSPRLWRGNQGRPRGLQLHKSERVKPSCMQAHLDDTRSINATRTCPEISLASNRWLVATYDHHDCARTCEAAKLGVEHIQLVLRGR